MKADIQLQHDVSEELKWSLQVMVEKGFGMLSGKLQSWAERETATTSAWATPGVRSVVDKITLEC